MKIKLKVAIKSKEDATREFELEFRKPEILIGRDSDCDIKIPHNSVSRRHALLFFDETGFRIKDLNSAVGTAVNGEMLSECKPIHHLDKIHIANAVIEFHELRNQETVELSEEKTAVVAQQALQDLFSNQGAVKSLPYFRVMNGEDEGAQLVFPEASLEFVLGRAKEADIRLDDKSISRRHARISKDWNTYFIENLESKNGLIVNGRVMESTTRLKDNDEVFLGKMHLIFHDPLGQAIGAFDFSEPTFTRVHDTVAEMSPLGVVNDNPIPTKTKPKKRVKKAGNWIETSLGVIAFILILGLLYGIVHFINFIP